MHQEFLTEDFLLYASECKRMAALARPPESHARKMAVTRPKAADLVSRIATRFGPPQRSYSGNQPAYS